MRVLGFSSILIIFVLSNLLNAIPSSITHKNTAFRIHQSLEIIRKQLGGDNTFSKLTNVANVQQDYVTSSVNSLSGHLSLNPSAQNGTCEKKMAAVVSSISNQPDCSELLRLLKTSDSTVSYLKSLCDNTCLDTFVHELTEIKHSGCNQQPTLGEFSQQCSSLPNCVSEQEAQCTNTWISQNCPDQLFSNVCEPYSMCALRSIHLCPKVDGSGNSSSVISFKVIVPLEITPEEFMESHKQEFIRATATAAGCSESLVHIVNATKGLKISADVTVTSSIGWNVYARLFNSLNSTSFRDRLNSQFSGSLKVPYVLRLSIGISLAHNDEPVIPVPYVPETPICPNNCSNHGKCTSEGCFCDKAYGRTNGNSTQDCSEYTLGMCSEKCYGHGICAYNGVEMTCQCFDGFHGPECNHWDRCKELDYCSGHGVCTRPNSTMRYVEEECICDPGFSGIKCENIEESCPGSCSGHGICKSEGHRHVCHCDELYSGPACNIFTGPRCLNDCSALGICVAGQNCTCAPGFSGTDCSTTVDVCNGCSRGYCHETCQCLPGYKGEHCNIYDATIDEGCTALSFCSGRGVCSYEHPDYKTAKCTCFEGFGGDDCSILDTNYEGMCLNYCSGHGKCVFSDTPHCVCTAGWKGDDCSLSECSDSSNLICNSHGICEKDESDKFVCTCDPTYNGTYCEHTICPKDCSGAGRCTKNGTCECNSGFTGDDCSVLAVKQNFVAQTATTTTTTTTSNTDSTKNQQNLQKREDEESVLDPSSCLNSCSKHGECVMGRCQCKVGYLGTDCSEEAPQLYEDADDLDKLDLLEIKTVGEAIKKPSMARLWD